MTDTQRAPSHAPIGIEPTPQFLITVSWGIATGPTKLAAFDEALQTAGIGNFNLVHLSSVIPPNSRVRSVARQAKLPGGWGDRCYVTLAEGRIDTPHEEIWAGLGWAQEDESGRGLFVEAVGHSHAQVSADIESTLEAMIASRFQLRFGERHSVIRGTTCIDEPACSLVAAAMHSTPWESHDEIVLP